MRTMIVEDTTLWQGIIRVRVNEVFQHSNVSNNTTVFSSYNTAFEALSTNSPWHLLVTDYSLKGSENDSLGAELCHEANKLGIPAIVISDKPHLTAQIVRELFIKYGIIDIYFKGNFQIDEFKETVRKEIERADQNRKDIIKHFEKDDFSNSVTAFVNKFNSKHLSEISKILDLIGIMNESELDLSVYLDNSKTLLKTIYDILNNENENKMAADIEKIRKYTENKNLDYKHSLKLTVPIIPFFLTYHGQMDKQTKIKLQELWNSLVNRFKCLF